MVPYALAPHWFDIVPNPEPKRILFAGSANMRKGIHHLAGAARRLAAHGYTFVVAGEANERVRAHPDSAFLTFLGRLPRSAMAEEFARADIFVLPSIAEGSAGVTYEAMAAAVPLVVSAAAGSVARDGVEGSVMSLPDAERLAAEIDRIASDRALRVQMSGAARDRARGLFLGAVRRAFEDHCHRSCPMKLFGVALFIVRAASEVLHRTAVLFRLTIANLTTFCFWRPLPLSTTIYGRLRILHRPCRFSIGPRGHLGDGLYLATSPTSTITAGADVTINLGCVMVAMERIAIGDRVAIAEYVTIRDQEHRFAKGMGVRGPRIQRSPC